MYLIYALSGKDYGMGHISRMANLARHMSKLAPVAMITNPESLSFIPNGNFSIHTYGNMSHAEAWHYTQAMYRDDDVKFIIDNKNVTDIDVAMYTRDHPSRFIYVDNPNANHDIRAYEGGIIPNIHSPLGTIKKAEYMCAPGKLFCGERYILMGENTLNIEPRTEYKLNAVAFFAGGSDPGNMSALFDMASGYLGDKRRMYRGAMADHHLDWPIYNLFGIRDVTLFVCAWGISVYESLSVGTPVLTVPRTQMEYWDALKLAQRIADAVYVVPNNVTELTLLRTINGLLQDRDYLEYLGKIGASVVDNLGVDRLATHLVEAFGR